MTTTTIVERPTGHPAAQATPRAYPPIGMTRLVSVEFRKMFDTRSGFWLMMSIGILSVVASAAAIAFAPSDELNYELMASAIGIPMSVLLPIIAILSITSEWSQRTGLTTFTFVPHRGRVITAKAICTLLIGVGSMLVAAGIGALGNILGSAIVGVDTVWDIAVNELALIILANVLGMTVGFMLGVLIRNSPGAVVGYFVYAFVLPPLSMLLASTQQWFADIQGWVDFNYAMTVLYDEVPTAAEWAHIGVSSLFWVLIPLAIGVRLVLRSEVK